MKGAWCQDASEPERLRCPRILHRYRKCSGGTFDFGQYRGHTYKAITEEEPHYYFWAKEQKRPGRALSKYIAWVEKYYHVDTSNRTVELKASGSGSGVFRAEEIAGSSGAKPKARSKKEQMRQNWIMVEKCEVF